MQREFSECTEISQLVESSALGFEHSQAPGRIFNSLCVKVLRVKAKKTHRTVHEPSVCTWGR